MAKMIVERIRCRSDETYDILLKYPDGFTLKRDTSLKEKSARRLLKKFKVVEKQCPLKCQSEQKVVSSVNIFYIFLY